MEIKTGISLSGRISIGCDNYGAIMRNCGIICPLR